MGVRRRDGRFLGERTTKKKQIPPPLPRARDDNLKRIATNTNYARLKAATTDSNATAITVRENANARASRAQPFEPGLPVLRMNCAAVRFTRSALTE